MECRCNTLVKLIATNWSYYMCPNCGEDYFRPDRWSKVIDLTHLGSMVEIEERDTEIVSLEEQIKLHETEIEKLKKKLTKHRLSFIKKEIKELHKKEVAMEL